MSCKNDEQFSTGKEGKELREERKGYERERERERERQARVNGKERERGVRFFLLSLYCALYDVAREKVLQATFLIKKEPMEHLLSLSVKRTQQLLLKVTPSGLKSFTKPMNGRLKCHFSEMSINPIFPI